MATSVSFLGDHGTVAPSINFVIKTNDKFNFQVE